MFCKKCGAQIESGIAFCPSCGAAVNDGDQSGSQNDFSSTVQNLNNTADSTGDFSPNDIEQNKVMSIFAYIGILVLIPILAAPNSKFARYHSNQGLILFIAEIAYGIVYAILSAILLAISWHLAFILTIISILGIVFLVFAIIGIVNVANGRAKELPIIGKFRILK